MESERCASRAHESDSCAKTRRSPTSRAAGSMAGKGLGGKQLTYETVMPRFLQAAVARQHASEEREAPGSADEASDEPLVVADEETQRQYEEQKRLEKVLASALPAPAPAIPSCSRRRSTPSAPTTRSNACNVLRRRAASSTRVRCAKHSHRGGRLTHLGDDARLPPAASCPRPVE